MDIPTQQRRLNFLLRNLKFFTDNFDSVSINGGGFVFVWIWEQIIWQIQFEPCVVFDVFDRRPLHGIHLQHMDEEIDYVFIEVVRNRENPRFDFLEKSGYVVVVKR